MRTLLPLLLLALFVAACDYSIVEQAPISPGASAVTITVTPGTATVKPGGTRQFRAVVTGSTDTTVTWSVVSGAGRIYPDGLFVAAEDSAGTTTIRARANADTSKAATALITVDPNAGDQITVTVTPVSASITVGQTQQFTATVAGATNGAVTWSIVSGPGTISPTGLYTAPASLATSPSTTTIQAVSVADASAIGRASIGVRSGSVEPNTICFERDVLPIFVSNCAMSGCHDPATREHGFDFTKTSGVLRGIVPGNPELSIIYRMITGQGKDGIKPGDDDHDSDDDHVDDPDSDDDELDDDDIMPPPPRQPLSPQQIDLIRRWILEGAGTEPCAPTSGCDTTNVSYGATIRPILETNCLGCHTGATLFNKEVDLSTHVGVERVALSGQLHGAITHTGPFTPMPYGTGTKIDSCAIEKIHAWIVRGAPNN